MVWTPAQRLTYPPAFGAVAPGSPMDQLQQARAQQTAAASMTPNTSGLATALNAASGFSGGQQENSVLAANPQISASLLRQDPNAPMQLPGAAPSNGTSSDASGGGLASLLGRKSDRLLKSEVTRLGTLPSGLPVYRYRLEGGPFEIGVMADDVARVCPDATWFDPDDGFARVDYARIW